MKEKSENQGRCVLRGMGDGYPEALVGVLCFSWYCEGLEGIQKRYRIRVFDGGHETIWDTGWIKSQRASEVLYEGEALKPDSDYYVQVMVEAEDERLAVSEEESFSTGLGDGDWQAQWLAPRRSEGAAPLFRKEFRVEEGVVRARLYLCGMGYHVGYMNGKEIGDDFLSPAWTDYGKRVCYVAYDVKDLLHTGVNVLGVCLGNGWYGTMSGMAVEKLLFTGQMSLEYDDGRKEWLYVKGNDGWMVNSQGPIKQNSIYIGEVYDAREELNDWFTAGAICRKEEGWDCAVVTEPPEGKMVPQNVEEIGCVEERKAVIITEPEEKTFVVDFGQNLAGVMDLDIQEPEGASVSVRYGEILDKNGMLNTANLRTAQAEDIYISGGKKAKYHPIFTYHGFRYAQIKGMSERPSLGAVRALVLRSRVEKAGNFQCGSPLLNKIQHMCEWTESNNLYGVPTDCPQRDERLGWLNDLTVRAEEAVFNFDMQRFYRKFLQDIGDAQGKSTGAIPDTVPYTRYGSMPADPVCSSYLILGWLLYWHYGDKETLEQHYDGYAAWTQYLENSTQEGIVTYSYYGDWAAPIAGNVAGSYGSGAVSSITPGELMSTGFLYYDAVLMGEFAQILRKDKDAVRWKNLADRTKEALNREYYHWETGTYATNSQASNTFMAWLDISPDKQRTADAIAKDVYAHEIHLTTGNLCSRYILEVLTENGYVDLAYALAVQTTYPSWGYMAGMGATTIWERWEYVDSGPLLGMASHDHPMYAAISVWFYKYLLGIQIIKPAFDEFQIKLYIPDKLEAAKGGLKTRKGTIAIQWNKIHTAELVLSLEVPFNTKCRLTVPAGYSREWVLNEEKIREKEIWLTQGSYKAVFSRIGKRGMADEKSEG